MFIASRHPRAGGLYVRSWRQQIIRCMRSQVGARRNRLHCSHPASSSAHRQKGGGSCSNAQATDPRPPVAWPVHHPAAHFKLTRPSASGAYVYGRVFSFTTNWCSPPIFETVLAIARSYWTNCSDRGSTPGVSLISLNKSEFAVKSDGRFQQQPAAGVRRQPEGATPELQQQLESSVGAGGEQGDLQAQKGVEASAHHDPGDQLPGIQRRSAEADRVPSPHPERQAAQVASQCAHANLRRRWPGLRGRRARGAPRPELITPERPLRAQLGAPGQRVLPPLPAQQHGVLHQPPRQTLGCVGARGALPIFCEHAPPSEGGLHEPAASRGARWDVRAAGRARAYVLVLGRGRHERVHELHGQAARPFSGAQPVPDCAGESAAAQIRSADAISRGLQPPGASLVPNGRAHASNASVRSRGAASSTLRGVILICALCFWSAGLGTCTRCAISSGGPLLRSVFRVVRSYGSPQG